MALDVRIGSGTGFELLAAAVAVADPAWRGVLHHGPEAHEAVRRHDPDLLPEVRRLGRFGWINLAGPLADRRGGWGRARLLDVAASLPAEELRWTLVGGRRRQLRARIADELVRAALAGDRSARRALRSALADSLLQVTPWLLGASDREVRECCLRVLSGFPELDRRGPSSAGAARALDTLGAERLLERVAPGVRYGDRVLDHVVLVTSVRAAPILVAVDEVHQTVILHPPLTDAGPPDPSVTLREVGRALGDDTRVRVLEVLRSGPRSLPDLCGVLATPRTTLLHHLALLRSAGLVDLQVGPGAEPNVYSMADQGFDALARAVQAFTTR